MKFASPDDMKLASSYGRLKPPRLKSSHARKKTHKAVRTLTDPAKLIRAS
jgi:hypothetical protein